MEDGISASKSEKLPKSIRYILLGFILLLYIVIIVSIALVGIMRLEENIVEGIIIILIGLCFLLLCISRYRAVYKKEQN